MITYLLHHDAGLAMSVVIFAFCAYTILPMVVAWCAARRNRRRLRVALLRCEVDNAVAAQDRRLAAHGIHMARHGSLLVPRRTAPNRSMRSELN